MQIPFSIVDAHVHFWNPDTLDYPWLARVPALSRPFLPDDYATATKGAGVDKMIFIECGCEPAQSLKEADWITGLAAGEPRLKGMVAQASVELGAGAMVTLMAHAKNPIVKGIRRNIQAETDSSFCLRPDFIEGVRSLAEFNFTFDLCIIPPQLPAVIQLVQGCPEVFFILDHCGKPAIRDHALDPWRQHLRDLAALPNVACKISGLVTEAIPGQCGLPELKPYVTHALECFGFDRVLYGGDWPVCELGAPYETWLAALESIVAHEPEAAVDKLFHGNAERIYRV